MKSAGVLEAYVTSLEILVDKPTPNVGMSRRKKAWRLTVGMFEGDPIVKEIIEEA